MNMINIKRAISPEKSWSDYCTWACVCHVRKFVSFRKVWWICSLLHLCFELTKFMDNGHSAFQHFLCTIRIAFTNRI